jgi:hypothetical protein
MINEQLEIAKLEFVKKAENLLKIDPYISINDILAYYKVIPTIRKPRPSPDQIEAAGYKHDGMGNIISKRGKIMSPTVNGKYKNMSEKLQNSKYKIVSIVVPNFGKWTIQVHTLVFALTHRRWPRDGYVIDHIDDDRFNNHPDNLREITPRNNNYAVKYAEKNNIKLNKTNRIQTNLNQFFN